jgi:hypothetical protein
MKPQTRYFYWHLLLFLEMALWETPIYRFRVPDGNEESETLKEVVIDVTDSAPRFPGPSDNLKQVLTRTFNAPGLEPIESVLEFGAGKLKNIPYLLEQGKSVCAVEFQELSKNPYVKKNLKKCRKYGNKFQELVFPNPFLRDTRHFDLVLLANMIPVMPIPAERLFLFDLLHSRVNRGKYLLWYAQKEGSYKALREASKNDFGDGLWMGKGKYLKTFYRYHPKAELDELMGLYGFEPVDLAFGISEDAKLYRKNEHNLFSGMLSTERIEKEIPVDEMIAIPSSVNFGRVKRTRTTKPILPNPRSLSIENLYVERIKAMIPGPDDAEVYHRTVSHALARIFRGSLRNMTIKQEMNEGLMVIDTVFTNSAESGFFKMLQSRTDCIHPIFEAKNLKDDPDNDDFGQVVTRLGDNTGHFGVLVCRKVRDYDRAIKRCKIFQQNHNIVMFLTDEDVFEMLELSRNGDNDEISDIMDRRLKDINF